MTFIEFGFLLDEFGHFPHYMRCTHIQQPGRQLSILYAPNAAPPGNLGKAVVVAAVVLGSETAGVLVTPSLITRGTRAFGPANREDSPRQ